MGSLFQSCLISMAFVPKFSSRYPHFHTLAYHYNACSSITNTNYHKPCCHCLRRRKNVGSIKACCHYREDAGGYTDISSVLTIPPEKNTGADQLIACTDMAVNVGMRTTTTSTMLTPPPPPQMDSCIDRKGIVQCLQQKNYFVTGATGFLAKVLIEKMLRTVPEVGKIFLLMKANDKEAAMDRLQNEIIDSELFKSIKQMHGKSYRAFMMSKLIPVVGNISSESNLGMDEDSASQIADEVHVIVNSAATTTFDERYDVALNTNTKGPPRLLSFAKKCKKLGLFLHISTAYVNGEREGIVSEKPFCLGESIAREKSTTSEDQLESFPVLDVEAEIELASNMMKSIHDNSVTQKMKQLGLQRAKMYGWQNTYVFSKAMGEMLINSMRGNIPVVVIRPSVVESTCREPFPGWIQGNRMLDPLILSYGKGQLPGFTIDPKEVIDVVPADMVVNAIMAAMGKHGRSEEPEGLTVYHVASSVVNPLLLGDLFGFSHEHFTTSPLMDSNGNSICIDKMKYFNCMDHFSSYIENEVLVSQSRLKAGATVSNQKLSPRLEKKSKRKVDHLIHLAKMYEPYMFYKAWFDNSNTQKLMKGMSNEEMRNFGFDMGSIDWKDYILNIHIPGLKEHVIKRRLISA